MKNNKYEYDVIIVGGGISGVSCAFNCQKRNLKTLLVEKESYLGGDITGGLVIPVMNSETKNYNTDFYNELVNTAKKFGAQQTYIDNNNGWFNPVLLKIVFDYMLTSVGCDIMFESEVVSSQTEKKIIKSLNIKSDTLSLPIVSKYYVDATGNASLSKLLKCAIWEDTSTKQPDSLRFIISGVDLNVFCDFLEELDSDKNVTTTYRIDGNIHLSTAFTWDSSKDWALTPYFTKAYEDKVLLKKDLAYFQVFTIANMPNSIALNCPRLNDYDVNKPLEYTEAIIDARKAILRLHKFLVEYLPGFKGSYISNIAPKVGKRETTRVKCKYDYSVNDIINQKTFDNPALFANYPIDIHSNKKNKSVLHKVCSYALPIEALESIDYDNLFVIGKIAGFDFKAQAALRVQSSCMSMGEAIAKHISCL